MTSRQGLRVRPELTLAHWTQPTRVVRLDRAVVDPPAQLAEPAEMGDMPDEFAMFDAVFATEDPWMLRLWSYDRDKREYGARWTRMRLRLNRRTVFAQLGTPSGVPVMWNHMTWSYGALGRVSRMMAAEKQLRGAMMLSSRALAAWGTSLEQVDAGLNAGLSIGVQILDQPKMKRAEGESAGGYDNPDDLVYGRVRVNEVSLTATPMISTAGLVGRHDGGQE